MLVEGAADRLKPGQNKVAKSCPKPSTGDLGITRNESSDWQKLAAVPAKVLKFGK